MNQLSLFDFLLWESEQEETYEGLQIQREWAMPNNRTFTIKPIKALVEAEVVRGGRNCRPVCEFL